MRAYTKLMLRAVRGSLSRFLAIFAIAALGTGFLAGLMATTPDMKDTMEAHYQAVGLADLRVLGTYGLSDGDLQRLSEIDGVREAAGGKSVDLVVSANGAGRMAVTFHALRGRSAAFSGLQLASGRWPQAPHELVVEDTDPKDPDFREGSVLSVLPENEDWEDSLTLGQYTVVGTVRSPWYMSMDREATNVGSGSIRGVVYGLPEVFAMEHYTAAWLWLEQSPHMDGYSQQYKDHVEDISDALEDLAESQKWGRYNELKAEIAAELADGWAEYEEGKAEGEAELRDARREIADAEADIAEGRQKLADAEREIADAEQELADGAVKIADGEQELADAETELADALKEIEDGQRELADGEKELADARAELDEAKIKLADGEKELADAAKEIADGEQEIADGWAQWRRGLGGLELGRRQLADAKQQLDAARAQLDQAAASRPMVESLAAMLPPEQLFAMTGFRSLAEFDQTVAAGEAQYAAGMAEYTAGLQQLTEMEGILTWTRLQLEQAEEDLAEGRLEYEDGLREFEENRQKYLDGEQEYADGLKEYEEGKAELEDGRRKYADGLREFEEGKADLAQARLDYADGLKKLEDGKKDYEEGLTELADGEKKLADGKKDYEEGLLEFETELRDARQELADAEAEAAEALKEEPDWFILDRTQSLSVGGYESNAEKIENIAKVFPIFFFAIAALVALTTMTRMVDEERSQIGTLKSLGYTGAAIAFKYLSYAAAASLTGSAAGMAICFKLFPWIIWRAYDIMYILPPLQAPVRWDLALTVGGVTVGAILLATWATVRAALREKPAALLQPKAPPPGKRIFLERLGPLWRRMKFTSKVTARNLFRYKKRMLMTVTGVAGCTALLLTGFGLRDGIGDIVNRQFSEIYQHDLEIDLKSGWAEDEAFMALLADTDQLSDPLPVTQAGVTGIAGDVQTDLQLRVPAEAEALNRHYAFRERVSKKTLIFDENAVFLTEKAAETLGVSAGEVLTLRDDGVTRQLTVTGIVENYIRGFLYVGKTAWEAAGGDAAEPRLLLCKMSKGVDQTALGEAILRTEGAASLNFILDSAKTFSDMLLAINAIVVLIIVCAGLLAFVVLYNLTNINLCERVKELATLKVLGFYQGELNAYVFRETVLLSALGALAGLFGGYFLEAFVIQKAEVDMIMFSRDIYPLSYILSLALTMLFACLVSLAMSKRLKNISMVESMKAPE